MLSPICVCLIRYNPFNQEPAHISPALSTMRQVIRCDHNFFTVEFLTTYNPFCEPSSIVPDGWPCATNNSGTAAFNWVIFRMTFCFSSNTPMPIDEYTSKG